MDGTKAGPAVIQHGCTDVLKGAATEIKRRFEGGLIAEQMSLMALVKLQ